MNSRSIDSHPGEKDVFLDALEIEDAAERKAFLERACAGDATLRECVDALLKACGAESERILDPNSYESLREGRDTFAELLGKEGGFLNDLGERIRVLGDYELLEELGRGAMGVVFKARQRSLNREVALKVIMGSALASEADRKRFHVEAEAAAQLEHPNIVPIFEIGRFEDHDYFSMPLIRGGTLGERMAHGKVPAREAVSMILKVANAVQAAHQSSILHRDLKPDNILLGNDGEPHVSDFGLASKLEQESTLTLSGQIMGTPQYMAPEQADAGTRRITTAADIYSLGAILYELLAGVPAFRGKSVLRTLQSVREDIPRSLRLHDKAIDRDLDTIVLKCLEKNPALRYDSAGALADDLTCWIEGLPISARAPSTAERLLKWARRRPVHAALVGVAALFLLTLGIGGPLAAFRQATLHKEADSARIEAEQERENALRSAELAQRQGQANRRLAYASNMRLVALAEQYGQKSSLAPESMIAAWFPGENQADVRDWEWYYNFGKIHRDARRIQVGGEIRSLDFSPFGERLAVGTSTGLEIRDGLTGIMIRQRAIDGGIVKIAWDPGGAMVAALDQEGALTIEDTRTAGAIGSSAGGVRLISFSWAPADRRLATLDAGGMLALLKIADDGTFSRISATKSSRGGLRKIAWSPDGAHIAAIGDAGLVLVWETAALSAGPELYQGQGGKLNDLAWHRSGTLLATASEEGSVRVWGVPGGKRMVKVVPKSGGKVSGPVKALAWRPQGQSLVYAVEGIDHLRVLDLGTGLESSLEPSWAYNGKPGALAWSAESQSVAVGGSGSQLVIGRADIPEPERIFLENNLPLVSIHWSADVDELTGIDSGGVLHTFTTSGHDRPKFPIEGFDPQRTPIAWHEGGPEIAMFSNSGANTRVTIIDPKPNGVPKSRVIPDFQATDIARDHGRGSLLLAGESGEVFGCDIDDHHPARFYRNETAADSPALRYLAPSPDYKWLLATGDHGRVAVWQMPGGELIIDHADPDVSESVGLPCWQPSGEHFAVVANSGEVSIWSLKSRKVERVIKAHRGGMGAIAWHPKGTRLATGGSEDSAIRIWDWETGEPVLTLTDLHGGITSLAWSPDGRRLAASSGDGVLRNWDAAAGILLSRQRVK